MVDYGYEASREIGKATGSLAGEGTSIFIQNIYNDNRELGMPEEIKKLLGLGGSEAILDADYEEIG